ncbi:hypothetical protein HanIR_Chr12g0593181 [Helianthus annuus]|nr:hypothetical protein HanIR_Chr12g0593181 [Helianthus annuus]
MFGFNRLCASRTGVTFSSVMILCITTEGLIPFKSAMVHPIAARLVTNTSINFFSCSMVKFDAIITGRVLPSPT